MTSQLDRRALLDNASVRGFVFCRALAACIDEWIIGLWNAADTPVKGAALVAVGGYGRAELSPGSDIDLYLIHDAGVDITGLADQLWYPIWDEGIKLGHAVRTVKETIALASDDLDTATAVLSVRFLAGDESLADQLREKGLAAWQKRSKRWLAELDERISQRHEQAGEVAFLLEPDLKDGRGGMRDVHGIRWAELAGIPLLPGDDDAIRDAYELVLSARVELHRRTGRHSDILLLEEQDAVAEALGFPDADALMHELSAAARTIAWVSDELWARVGLSLEGSSLRRRLSRHFWRRVALGNGYHFRRTGYIVGRIVGARSDGCGVWRCRIRDRHGHLRLGHTLLAVTAAAQRGFTSDFPISHICFHEHGSPHLNSTPMQCTLCRTRAPTSFSKRMFSRVSRQAGHAPSVLVAQIVAKLDFCSDVRCKACVSAAGAPRLEEPAFLRRHATHRRHAPSP